MADACQLSDLSSIDPATGRFFATSPLHFLCPKKRSARFTRILIAVHKWLQSLIIGELHKISDTIRRDMQNHNQPQNQRCFLGMK